MFWLRFLLQSLSLIVFVYLQLLTPVDALLENIPRYNFITGSLESNDLGSYDLFICEGGKTSDDPSSSRSCKLSDDSDGEVINYLGGAGFLTVLGFVAIVILVLGTLGYIILAFCRCCFRCCTKNEVKEREGVKIWSSLSYFVCLVMILVCFLVSTYNGNYAITENTSSNEEYSAANSLNGIKNIIHTFEPSVTNTMLASTSHVLRPALEETNKTLNAAVSIHEIIEAFDIMDRTIPKLPDAHGVLNMLNTTKTIIHNSSDYLGLILTNLDDIDLLVEEMLDDTGSMYNSTLELNEINDVVLENIEVLNASITIATSFLNEVVGDDGIVENGVDDLKAVQRVEDGGLVPNADVFQDASTGATGSTSRLLSGDLNGNSAEINLMNDKLIAIDKNLTALPNYTVTANQLVYLNDTIRSALDENGLIANLTSAMNALDESIQSPIPILYDIMASISSFSNNLDELTVEMADNLHVVRIMLPLIETLLPQFDFLENEVNKMYAAEDLLPVLDIMIKQFEGVNRTLFLLTDPFIEGIDSIREVNDTLQDYLYNGTLDDILTQVGDANQTVVDALADAEEELENLEDFEEVLLDSINDYNISDINDTVSDAISLLEDIDFNETYDRVVDFRQSLEAVKIDEDFVNSLYEWQDKLDQILGLMDRAVGPSGDYVLLEKGHCVGRNDVYCTVDSDCVAVGATTCDAASIGTYRCASPIGNITCSNDADCSSSYCLSDTTRGATMHNVLVAFADDSNDLDVDEILSDLEDILASSDVNLTDASNMLEDGLDSMEVFNTSEILTLIDDIESGINDFDTESIRDQLGTTQETMDDVDFDSFMEQIESNLDIYDRVSNNTFIESWTETFETVKDFMFKNDFLKSYLDNLKGPVLASILNAEGPSAAIGHIGAQLDRALDDFRYNQSEIDVGDSDVRYSTEYEKKYVVLDKAGASRYPTTPYSMNDQHGSLYYLFALASDFTIGDMKSVQYNYAKVRGIFANSEGYRYEEQDSDNDSTDLYCLTTSCFEYTMNKVNTAPLSDVSDELFPPSEGEANDDSVSTDSDYSREELMSLLWWPVAVLFLIGLCTFLTAFCVRCYKVHLCCNCCFLTCALMILPCIFFFSSIFILLATVGEDTCTSGTSIGESYIMSYGDEFCKDSLGGVGTLTDCKFDWTLPDMFGDDENITLSVNILDAYNALFQESCDMAVDPFEKIAVDLADQVKPLPLKASDKALSESLYELQPPLENIINMTSINYGEVLYNLITEANFNGDHKVMSCESMSLIYSDIEETGCEGVVLPSVWLIASWYVVAWSICCCGIPASCATMLKKKSASSQEVVSDSEDETDYDESTDEGDDSHEDQGIQMQNVHLQEDSMSSDDDFEDHSRHQQRPTAPTYTVIDTGAPGAAGVRHVSGNMPQSGKESGNSYLDRSGSRASALGLNVPPASRGDSRFQTTRSMSKGSRI